MRKRNSIQCPKIDDIQCRINTIHLTVGEGGGGKDNLGAKTALKTEGNFLKYFCERCIQMSFRQWRVAVVVMLSTTILLRGGVGVCTLQIFFCRNFGQIFFIHQWPLSLTVKGGIKYPLIYRGMVEDAKFSKTSFKNQSADVKGTLWSTI